VLATIHLTEEHAQLSLTVVVPAAAREPPQLRTVVKPVHVIAPKLLREQRLVPDGATQPA
jgi:hypothetical protein